MLKLFQAMKAMMPGLGWRKAGEKISKGGPKDNF
jgi:hypothetical protein